MSMRDFSVFQRVPSVGLHNPEHDYVFFNNYSIFGIGVDRKHDAKCLFPQEKGTLHAA
jgi:hypothetical protein